MRSFRHWTPRYIKNRLAVFYYEKNNPDRPWLTKSATEIFASWLKNTDVGLEFGSGRSTLWFAKRIAHLVSIEHNEIWAAKVRSSLAEVKLANVNYRLLPVDSTNVGESSYVRVLDEFSDNSLDFCLIDGTCRQYRAIKAIDKIRPSGLLIIDNVERYLPSSSHSPVARRLVDGADGPVWQEVERRFADWRRIWTSSGVTDTALFFKPDF